MVLSNGVSGEAKVDFLKLDANKHDYMLIKNNKSVYNLRKSQIYNVSHSSIQNYFLNPKNNYPSNPFNGSSNFYIDWELPKLQSLFHQIVLRFSVKNTHSSATGVLMPSPLMIEKVSLLKNSNSLGLDVDSFDVFSFNLNKYYNEQQKDDVSIFGLTKNTDNNLVSVSKFELR